jgi:hypothetical protein
MCDHPCKTVKDGRTEFSSYELEENHTEDFTSTVNRSKQSVANKKKMGREKKYVEQ